MRRGGTTVVAVALVALLALAGCSGLGTDDTEMVSGSPNATGITVTPTDTPTPTRSPTPTPTPDFTSPSETITRLSPEATARIHKRAIGTSDSYRSVFRAGPADAGVNASTPGFDRVVRHYRDGDVPRLVHIENRTIARGYRRATTVFDTRNPDQEARRYRRLETRRDGNLTVRAFRSPKTLSAPTVTGQRFIADAVSAVDWAYAGRTRLNGTTVDRYVATDVAPDELGQIWTAGPERFVSVEGTLLVDTRGAVRRLDLRLRGPSDGRRYLLTFGGFGDPVPEPGWVAAARDGPVLIENGPEVELTNERGAAVRPELTVRRNGTVVHERTHRLPPGATRAPYAARRPGNYTAVLSLNGSRTTVQFTVDTDCYSTYADGFVIDDDGIGRDPAVAGSAAGSGAEHASRHRQADGGCQLSPFGFLTGETADGEALGGTPREHTIRVENAGETVRSVSVTVRRNGTVVFEGAGRLKPGEARGPFTVERAGNYTVVVAVEGRQVRARTSVEANCAGYSTGIYRLEADGVRRIVERPPLRC